MSRVADIHCMACKVSTTTCSSSSKSAVFGTLRRDVSTSYDKVLAIILDVRNSTAIRKNFQLGRPFSDYCGDYSTLLKLVPTIFAVEV